MQDDATRPGVQFNHLYDKQRIELARLMLSKEFHKIFHGLPEAAWPAIEASMQGWAEQPTDYGLSGDYLIDFWDGVDAIMGGLKLTTSVITWLTAENVRWQRGQIPVGEIEVTSMLTQLNKIPGLTFTGSLSLGELLDFLADKPEIMAEQKQLDQLANNEPKDQPIIIRKVDDSRYKIMDGNHRALHAALTGAATIDAWWVELDGDEPRNFWVPVNELLRLTKIFKEAQQKNDSALQQSVARVLRHVFDSSAPAKRLYETRVNPHVAEAPTLYDAANNLA